MNVLKKILVLSALSVIVTNILAYNISLNDPILYFSLNIFILNVLLYMITARNYVEEIILARAKVLTLIVFIISITMYIASIMSEAMR